MVLDLVLYQDFVISLFILEQFFNLVCKILLPLGLHVLDFRCLIRGRDIFDEFLILLILGLSRLLLHPLCHSFKSILNLINDNALIGSINSQWLSTSLEDPETVKSGQMRLLVLLGYDPWLDSVKDHLVNSDSVPQVNGLLKTQDS